MADTSSKKPAVTAKAKRTKAVRTRRQAPRLLRPITGYFGGAWRELRETKWPTRRATWSLTIAVIGFTAALMLFIVGIDYLFELVFKKFIL